MRKFVLGASFALAVAAGRGTAQQPPAQAPAPIVPATSGGVVVGTPPAIPIDGGAPIVPYGAALEGVPVGEPVAGTGTGYVEASFLLLWASDAELGIPLATSGTSVGILGRQGTTVLVGPGDIDYNAQPGIKVLAGRMLPGTNVGVEVGGFYLGNDTLTTTLGPSSQRVIARPFFDPTTRAENVRVVASPGAFRGGMVISSGIGAFGFETNSFVRTRDGAPFTLDLLAGFRYFQNNEDFTIYDASTVLAGGTTAFNGVGLGSGSSVVVSDIFNATNIFYGGQVGARFGFGRGGLFFDLTGKVALGGVYQRLNVDGATVATGGVFPAPVATSGGFLTSGGQTGVRSEGRFAVLPEVNAQLGYQFTSWLNAFVGYQVLYLSSAARPSEQLSRGLTATGLPTSPTYRRPPVQTGEILDGDLWLHGFNFGLTMTY